MDKKSLKNRSNPLLVELTYQQNLLGGSTVQALDRAFDVLFDEVLRRKESKAKEAQNMALDNYA